VLLNNLHFDTSSIERPMQGTVEVRYPGALGRRPRHTPQRLAGNSAAGSQSSAQPSRVEPDQPHRRHAPDPPPSRPIPAARAATVQRCGLSGRLQPWPAQPERRGTGPLACPLSRPVRPRRRQAARPQRAGFQGHDPGQPWRDHTYRGEIPDR
jgi:hypothetical protein